MIKIIGTIRRWIKFFSVFIYYFRRGHIFRIQPANAENEYQFSAGIKEAKWAMMNTKFLFYINLSIILIIKKLQS